ncbi:MAG TPA: FGGY family carbohydrate kinase [Acidimicrobiales bacterium]|nr:FGGY family carbohydrate kinase [Acidimicrobiales bacterium]
MTTPAGNPVVIGADIGSQSAKAGLFALDGTCLAEASVEVPVHRRAADEVDQDPGDFYCAATATISACVAKSGCRPADVAGLAVAGQMAGVLGVGTQGQAVTPYDSWLDSRCRPEVERIAGRFGRKLAEVTGCPPMVDHAPKMAWWRHNRPSVYARVAKFVVPSAFVAGRLCDLPAERSYIDWTHLHFSGLADAASSTWSAELAEGADIEMGRLPRILAPTALVGGVSAAAAADCGLLAGTPVAAGLGDTAAGALGAGIVRAGQVLDTSGTASVLAVSTDSFQPDPSGALLMMRGAVAGQWISLSYLAGGDLLSWLPGVLGAASLDLLVGEAASVPPGRLLFMPHLGGRILPAAPSARGAWVGLNLSQERGDLVRSVLESIAYEYAGFLARAVEIFPGLVPTDVRVIGGGSHDRLWNQVKASTLGLPYARLKGPGSSCWGVALVAARAVGAVDDLAAAALAASEVAEQVRPEPHLHALYSERQRQYRALVDLFVPRDQEAHA